MSVVMVTKRNHATDVWQWQVQNLDLQLNFDGSNVASVGQVESDIFRAAIGTSHESTWKIILRAHEGYVVSISKKKPLTFQAGLQFLGIPDLNDNSQSEKVERATAHYEIKLCGDGQENDGNFFHATDTANFILARVIPQKDGRPGSVVMETQNAAHFIDVMPFEQLSLKRRELFSQNQLTVSVKLTLIFTNLHEQQNDPQDTHGVAGSFIGKKRDILGGSIAGSVGQLVGQKKLADVRIVCGQKEFFAHRVILSARSSVLCALCETPTMQQIKIDDIDPTTLERMLKHIYSDENNVPNLVEEEHEDEGRGHDLEAYRSLFNMLDCAQKYDLPDLKANCLDKMCGSLNDGNAAKFAMIAYKYKAESYWMENIQGYCLRRHRILMKNAKYREIYCQNPQVFVGEVESEAK